MSWRSLVAIRLCRVLPPSLAYRAQFRLFSHLIGSSEPFDERVLFGPGRISGTMRDAADAYFALHWTNSYQGMTLACATIEPGDTVFELGANSGTETLSLANLVGLSGKVVAVEVDSRTANLLKKRLASNHVSTVHVVEQAVAEFAASVYFHAGSPVNTGSGFIASSRIEENAVLVKTITLNQLTARFGPPNFIWMDLEGAEYAALAGGRETLENVRPVIFSEVKSPYLERAGASLEQLLTLLSSLDYQVLDARRWFAPRLTEDHCGVTVGTDCIFIPREKSELIPVIRRRLLLARVLPKIPLLHPILR